MERFSTECAPFSLVAPGWAEGLLWTGDKMVRKAVRPVAQTVLAVSHRAIGGGAAFFADSQL